MIQAISCPNASDLRRFLLGHTGESEAADLEEHILRCEKCLHAVQALPVDDPLICALRHGRASATPAPRSDLLEKLRLRLQDMGPSARGEDTAAVENTAAPAPASAFDATEHGGLSLAPPQQPDEIGRLGGYRILKELGRGGMGVVYQAEDVKLKRLVALKAMLPNLAADAVARQRFLREAQAMAAVRHDHVVTVFQVDEVNGVPFLAMEFLQGMPLDKWLKEGRKPSVAQVLRIGREMAEGLAAAHERGLIHRDIKPGNVWLDSAHKGRVKILDFGLARAGQEDVHLTRSGAIVGTPAYMAPEQARGEKVDPRSDLFSLGCVLYKLCAGAMPFAGDTTMSLLTALALDHPRPVRELNGDIPAELSELVMKLLEKDPARRPASAREVVQALQALERQLARKQEAEDRTVALRAAPRPAPIASLPTTPRAVPPRRRVGALVGLLLGGAAVVAAAAAIIVIIRTKDGDKVTEINVPPGGKVEIADDGKKDGPGVAPKAAVDDAWAKQVAALPADKQVEAVVAALKSRNPGFDGKATPKIEDGVVTELYFLADNVTDISPARALTGLRLFSCIGSNYGLGKLADLSPLKDLKLTKLNCDYTKVADLSPLKGMPLTILNCDYTQVADLSPLKGMPLTDLYCYNTQVADLSPLKGMPLTDLSCNYTQVSDLSPLKGMPLTELNCGVTKVADLAPLKDMKLTYMNCGGTQVSDLSPLKGMPLTFLDCWQTQVSDLSPLKGMPLTYMRCGQTQVSDLSPLKDAKLTTLYCYDTKVADLSPLKGMPLEILACNATQVADLSPLKGMPLKELWCDFDPKRDADILRSLKTLETINNKPAADFWKDVDAKKP